MDLDLLTTVLMRGDEALAVFVDGDVADEAAAQLNDGDPEGPYWTRDYLPVDPAEDPAND